MRPEIIKADPNMSPERLPLKVAASQSGSLFQRSSALGRWTAGRGCIFFEEAASFGKRLPLF